ncbi:MAG: ABC transporter ATP-binding protein [Oscillospiraceae bacterium]|nr:ABC transporter ATP-binding protein [Oscillospiraceae bacterium]
MENKLLELKDVRVKYHTLDYDVMAVNGVSLELNKGESLGLVGETGAGKTTLALSILGLLPKGVGEVYEGEIIFKGEDLLQVPEKRMRDIRGMHISMIFQDPMTSLNPVYTVGDQIAEVLQLHGNKHPDERVDEILGLVGIDPSRKVCYPHQFSGGMKQRIVIAMALACEPDLLLADEPTTALDVTIQAQVLAMIDDIQKKLGTSMILITHDLGVVAETCDKVAIMYAGEIVEYGTLHQVFDKTRPHHPYTVGLFGSIPDLSSDKRRLEPIYGMTPDPSDLPEGCYFSPRCNHCTELCKQKGAAIHVSEDGHMLKCHLFTQENKEAAE